MKRSQLKTQDATDVLDYKKQRHYGVKLNNQCKENHFDRLNPEKDSKPFWKNCKLYFSFFSNKHFLGKSKIASTL